MNENTENSANKNLPAEAGMTEILDAKENNKDRVFLIERDELEEGNIEEFFKKSELVQRIEIVKKVASPTGLIQNAYANYVNKLKNK